MNVSYIALLTHLIVQDTVWYVLLWHSLQTPEREFRIRISGLEIYNENVRDLLNSESGRNLKLLDDPEVRHIHFD